MGPYKQRHPLSRTGLLWKSRQTIDHLEALLVFAFALAFDAKHLSDLTPVPTQIVVEIRTGGDLASFQSAMAFLNLFVHLPGRGRPRIHVKIVTIQKGYAVAG